MPVPYDKSWTMARAREFFALPARRPEVEVLSRRNDSGLQWQEISFQVRPGLNAPATIVNTGAPDGPGVLLPNGDSDDARRFFLEEAGHLARRGATVILPVTRFSEHGDIDELATALRDAVWT